ncbi:MULTISPECIES: FMN-binding protein [unclassified Rathayibacter]|uniref:FMN-binding protein n=1 Tax=unclassified Rathayibacter TaxID=2609250 RepID=UPI00188C9452|nr:MULTISPECIES: FMN-binding protein [unclassified Rathayibacter]MBF4463395.1 FMN-binding protein [Rathayibacter sp. VKM Ac-2879]MBF4504882.1 FMN-binding protein [Rathayibacter sp. VKM Ac-2878]
MTAKTTTSVRYALTLLAGAGTLAALSACSSTTTAGSADAMSTADSASSAPTASSAPAATGSASSTGSYADGTYQAEGSYTSPGGTEKIGVSLTLAGDVVTAVTVTPESENPTGDQYQDRFAGGIAGEVVGKKLDDLKVSKVSGSSLTSGGFNQAVDAIKADAKA